MIDRRAALLAGALGVAALPLCASSGAAERPARRPERAERARTADGVHREKRPNILVIVTDDQPADTAWGLPYLTSYMAEHGVTFENAHTTTPLCAPARATILTGQYAHDHRVRNNNHPRLIDDDATITARLREAGYQTGMVGKYLNGWRKADPPPNFEKFALMPRAKYKNTLWNVNGVSGQRAGYSTTIVRDEALAFLRETDDRPWFLYVAPYAPHQPFTPEKKYANIPVPEWQADPAATDEPPGRPGKPPYIQASTHTAEEGRELRAAQLRSLRSVDDLFRALVAELEESGRLDDTLIIVAGDNGYCWGHHGWLRKSVPYQPALRVPLAMSWRGGTVPEGVSDDRLAANIDIAPTIADAAGVELPAASGLSLLQGWERVSLLAEWWDGHEPNMNQPPTWASIVTPSWQFTEYYDTFLDRVSGLPTEGTGDVVFREYYDLENDPSQLTNLLDHDGTGGAPVVGVPELSARLARARGVSAVVPA